MKSTDSKLVPTPSDVQPVVKFPWLSSIFRRFWAFAASETPKGSDNKITPKNSKSAHKPDDVGSIEKISSHMTITPRIESTEKSVLLKDSTALQTSVPENSMISPASSMDTQVDKRHKLSGLLIQSSLSSDAGQPKNVDNKVILQGDSKLPHKQGNVKSEILSVLNSLRDGGQTEEPAEFKNIIISLEKVKFLKEIKEGVYVASYEEKCGNRRVVVKVVNSHDFEKLAQETASLFLLRECESVIRLIGFGVIGLDVLPKLVPVWSVDRRWGFFVIECMPYQLDKVLESEKPLLWSVRLQILLDIAMALKRAEESFIIHGDIKSENIMLTKELRAKLIDFGVSVMHDEAADAVPRGTNGFLAPEIIAGTVSISHLSDIYSYGLVLFHVIFRGNFLQLMQRNFTLEDRPTDCPKGLFKLGLACCCADPQMRPKIDTIISSLQEIIAHPVKVEDEKASFNRLPPGPLVLPLQLLSDYIDRATPLKSSAEDLFHSLCERLKAINIMYDHEKREGRSAAEKFIRTNESAIGEIIDEGKKKVEGRPGCVEYYQIINDVQNEIAAYLNKKLDEFPTLSSKVRYS